MAVKFDDFAKLFSPIASTAGQATQTGAAVEKLAQTTEKTITETTDLAVTAGKLMLAFQAVAAIGITVIAYTAWQNYKRQSKGK